MEIDQKNFFFILWFSSLKSSTVFLDSLFRVSREVGSPSFLFLLFPPTNKRQYGTNSVASLGFVVVPVGVEQVGLSINHFVVVILCPNEPTSPTLFLVFSRIEECKQRIENMHVSWLHAEEQQDDMLIWFIDALDAPWISSSLLT